MSRPTIGDWLKHGTAALTMAGVESPALDAGLILAEALATTRLKVLTEPNESIGNDALARAEAMLARRTAREPLAYIVGRKEFYGLNFAVTPAVLIPRPETELLVDAAIAWLKERVDSLAPPRIADVGTGSGAIAVSIAFAMQDAKIFAIDNSIDALTVAARNAEEHGVSDKIQFSCGSLLGPVDACLGGRLDLICANLPYVPEASRASLAPEVVNFEPPGALFADVDGLTLIFQLIESAPHYLRPGGAIMLECGIFQAERIVQRLCENGRFDNTRIIDDLAGIKRVIVATCA